MQSIAQITNGGFIFWYLSGVALFSYLMFRASGFKNPWGLLLLFLFNSVMVGVGPILTILLYFYLVKRDKNSVQIKIHSLDLQQLKISYPIITRDYREGPLERFLMNETSSQERKVKLLSYLKEKFDKDDMRLFQATLSGKGDESRLFCFGIINQMEKTLNDKINDLSQKLLKCNDPIKKSEYEKELGSLYWEFVYNRLVSKDLEEFYLKHAKKYILNTINSNPKDIELLILLAKIYLKMQKYDDAIKIFEDAAKNRLYKDEILKN